MSGGFDTASSVMRRALAQGAIAAAAIALAASIVGGILTGWPGVLSGVVGAGFALLFLGVTAASLLVADRFGGLESSAFFAALLGGWLVKFVVFLLAMLALRDQPWVQPVVLFCAVAATVIASLVVDVLVVGRARIPVGSPRR
ncbi:hypothetical protein [Amnibacterium endophyticum]|uniref:3-oxoacyl-ACP reductase n=1 Tax=Amnibacterium endophyticum TaxID=2109337 RepID=A0ABW4LDU6_9MICO